MKQCLSCSRKAAGLVENAGLDNAGQSVCNMYAAFERKLYCILFTLPVGYT